MTYNHYIVVLSSVCKAYDIAEVPGGSENSGLGMRLPLLQVSVTKPLASSPSGSEIRLNLSIERDRKSPNLETIVKEQWSRE